MSFFANRLVGTVAGLALVSALLVSCSDEAAAPATTAASSKASTATTTSSTPSPSESRVIPVAAPRLGSTWTPPPENENDAKKYEAKVKLGYRISFQDPQDFPPPAQVSTPPPTFAIGQMNEETALKFPAFFLESFRHFLASKSPNSWRDYYTETCTICTSLDEEYLETFRRGGYVLSTPPIVSRAQVVHVDGTTYYVDAQLTMPPIKSYNPKNSLAVDSPDFSGNWRFKLEWNPTEGFQMADMGNQDE